MLGIKLKVFSGTPFRLAAPHVVLFLMESTSIIKPSFHPFFLYLGFFILIFHKTTGVEGLSRSSYVPDLHNLFQQRIYKLWHFIFNWTNVTVKVSL